MPMAALWSPGPWVEFFALLASIVSSLWLLKVCSPVSKLLSSRQLWHLGLADCVHASIQLMFSEIPHDVMFLEPPSLEVAYRVRAAIHFCLITL
eukprot:g1092.t1